MFKVIKDNFLISLLVGLLLAAISFLVLINISYKYKATAEVLVVQDQLGTQDFYSLTKSAEYLGNILVEAAYSTTFIDVVKEGEQVDSSFFPNDRKEQLKKWKKMVRIERSSSLGILKVVVFSDNKDEAYKLTEAITTVLRHKNYLFRGKTNVDIRLLSSVLVDDNPNIKTILVVVLGSFALGFMVCIVFVYYRVVYKQYGLVDGISLRL
jgi:capsular polysaccharide biosynthesis protein